MQRATIGGIVTGLVCALIWFFIDRFAKGQAGAMALGVGILVGVVVRFAANNDSRVVMAIAAGCVFGSVLIGKFAAVLVLTKGIEKRFDDMQKANPVTEQTLIIHRANDVVMEAKKRGRPFRWPGNKEEVKTAVKKNDFPPEVWAEAKRR